MIRVKEEKLETLLKVLVEIEGDVLEKEGIERSRGNTRDRVMSFKILHDIVGGNCLLKRIIMYSERDEDEDIDPTLTEEELEEGNG
jgi:hypothetical protein